MVIPAVAGRRQSDHFRAGKESREIGHPSPKDLCVHEVDLLAAASRGSIGSASARHDLGRQSGNKLRWTSGARPVAVKYEADG